MFDQRYIEGLPYVITLYIHSIFIHPSIFYPYVSLMPCPRLKKGNISLKAAQHPVNISWAQLRILFNCVYNSTLCNHSPILKRELVLSISTNKFSSNPISLQSLMHYLMHYWLQRNVVPTIKQRNM